MDVVSSLVEARRKALCSRAGQKNFPTVTTVPPSAQYRQSASNTQLLDEKIAAVSQYFNACPLTFLQSSGIGRLDTTGGPLCCAARTDTRRAGEGGVSTWRLS